LIHQIIENRQIEGIQSEKVEFANCVFEHVEFRNDYKTGYFFMEHCEFKNCIFHDTFGVFYSDITNNLFQDCLFEEISTGRKNEGIYLLENKFLNCIFKNID